MRRKIKFGRRRLTAAGWARHLGITPGAMSRRLKRYPLEIAFLPRFRAIRGHGVPKARAKSARPTSPPVCPANEKSVRPPWAEWLRLQRGLPAHPLGPGGATPRAGARVRSLSILVSMPSRFHPACQSIQNMGSGSGSGSGLRNMNLASFFSIQSHPSSVTLTASYLPSLSSTS